jgi:3-dehydroquinate synthase
LKIIDIQGSLRLSHIYIGEKLEQLKGYLHGRSTIIITDATVWELYHRQLPPCPVVKIATGEKVKSLETVQAIYSQLIELEADRSTLIVGIGGGIVCDISGFVASTFMRGLPFGFVSTTLLSQVDASVGGKNGVNFQGYKNMVGVFNQPEFVLCDLKMLSTLPKPELINGFAEIVKHAAIYDEPLFAYLENHTAEALKLNPAVMEKLIYRSIQIKAEVVSQDETEKGARRQLNFGHTFGHAIEKITHVSHGEAVSAGMMLAAQLSQQKNLIDDHDVKRLESLLTKLKLPTRIITDQHSVLDALGKDKKREADRIHFVLLDRIGHAVIRQMPIQEIEAFLSQSNGFQS